MDFNDRHLSALISKIYSRPSDIEYYINQYNQETRIPLDKLFYNDLKEYSKWFLGNGIQITERSNTTHNSIEEYCNKELEKLNYKDPYNKEDIDKIKNAREETDRQHKKEFGKKGETTMTVNIHGNNSAPIFQLSESELNNPIQHTTTNTKDTIPPKRSVLEILSWIVGIIIGAIGIYEFIFRKG